MATTTRPKLTRQDVADLAVLAWAAITLVVIGLAWFGVIE